MCFTQDSNLLSVQALVLSEYGVGGGVSPNGDIPATNASQAGETPFFGVFGSYDPAIGEWQPADHAAALLV